MIENINTFQIMELVGIRNDEKLFCLDLIQYARSEVMRAKNAENQKG